MASLSSACHGRMMSNLKVKFQMDAHRFELLREYNVNWLLLTHMLHQHELKDEEECVCLVGTFQSC